MTTVILPRNKRGDRRSRAVTTSYHTTYPAAGAGAGAVAGAGGGVREGCGGVSINSSIRTVGDVRNETNKSKHSGGCATKAKTTGVRGKDSREREWLGVGDGESCFGGAREWLRDTLAVVFEAMGPFAGARVARYRYLMYSVRRAHTHTQLFKSGRRAHTHAHTHTHTHAHTNPYTYSHTYKHARPRIRTHTLAHTNTYIYTHIRTLTHKYTHTNIHLRIYIHARAHLTQTHACERARIHTHTHTLHIHTHTS